MPFSDNSEFTAKFFISAAELKALFHGGHFVILRCAKLEKHLQFIGGFYAVSGAQITMVK